VETATGVNIVLRIGPKIGITGLLAVAGGCLSVFLIVAPIVSLLIWAVFGTEVMGRTTRIDAFGSFVRIVRERWLLETLFYSALIGVAVSSLSCAVIVVHFFADCLESTISRLLTGVFVLGAIIFPVVVY
jgi:hypothetical protein